MNNNKPLFKRMLTLSSILIIGVLILTACNGAGGIDISGGLQSGESGQSGEGQGINQTTLILIVAGVVILIVIALARRK